MRTLLSAMVMAIAVTGGTGCLDEAEPISCDESTPCTSEEKPFCDLEGVYPESMGRPGTCVSAPGMGHGADASVPDAAVADAD